MGNVFDESHVSPEDIKTVADLQRLPVTTKTELQKFNNALNCNSVAKTDTPHMLIGVQDGPSLMGRVWKYLTKPYMH